MARLRDEGKGRRLLHVGRGAVAIARDAVSSHVDELLDRCPHALDAPVELVDARVPRAVAALWLDVELQRRDSRQVAAVLGQISNGLLVVQLRAAAGAADGRGVAGGVERTDEGGAFEVLAHVERRELVRVLLLEQAVLIGEEPGDELRRGREPNRVGDQYREGRRVGALSPQMVVDPLPGLRGRLALTLELRGEHRGQRDGSGPQGAVARLAERDRRRCHEGLGVATGKRVDGGRQPHRLRPLGVSAAASTPAPAALGTQDGGRCARLQGARVPPDGDRSIDRSRIIAATLTQRAVGGAVALGRLPSRWQAEQP